jgi:hypothetical protein
MVVCTAQWVQPLADAVANLLLSKEDGGQQDITLVLHTCCKRPLRLGDRGGGGGGR